MNLLSLSRRRRVKPGGGEGGGDGVERGGDAGGGVVHGGGDLGVAWGTLRKLFTKPAKQPDGGQCTSAPLSPTFSRRTSDEELLCSKNHEGIDMPYELPAVSI